MPWPSLKLNYLKQRYYSCTHGIPCLGNGFHKQNIVMTWKSCAKSRRAQALLKELADLSADASQAGGGAVVWVATVPSWFVLDQQLQ
jgi:hypothetical protein